MDSIKPEGMSSSQREDLMDQVKQQIVIANTQELLTVRGRGGRMPLLSSLLAPAATFTLSNRGFGSKYSFGHCHLEL